MATETDVRQVLRKFFAENFLLDPNGFSLGDDESLIEAGVVDSTGILELIEFIEGTFGISVANEEIVPDHFDCVRRIAEFIAAKTA